MGEVVLPFYRYVSSLLNLLVDEVDGWGLPLPIPPMIVSLSRAGERNGRGEREKKRGEGIEEGRGNRRGEREYKRGEGVEEGGGNRRGERE